MPTITEDREEKVEEADNEDTVIENEDKEDNKSDETSEELVEEKIEVEEDELVIIDDEEIEAIINPVVVIPDDEKEHDEDDEVIIEESLCDYISIYGPSKYFKWDFDNDEQLSSYELDKVIEEKLGNTESDSRSKFNE